MSKHNIHNNLKLSAQKKTFILWNVLDLFSMSREAFLTEYFYSDKVSGGNHRLSLYLAPHSFLYATFSDSGLVSGLGEIKMSGSGALTVEMIEMLLNNYGLGKTQFQKVDISVLNSSFTIIPEAYATVSDIKTLLNFNTGASVTRALKHNVDEAEFCYAVDNEMLSYLERTFPNASIRHSGAVGIYLLFNHHSLKDKDLYLNIAEGVVEIAAKEKSRLNFYNVFNYSTNEDILYFLLFTMEQLEMDPLKVKVAISGQRGIGDELIKTIRKYIKQVNFCVHDPSVKLHGDPASLPGHFYFTLLNQHLCEL